MLNPNQSNEKTLLSWLVYKLWMQRRHLKTRLNDFTVQHQMKWSRVVSETMSSKRAAQSSKKNSCYVLSTPLTDDGRATANDFSIKLLFFFVSTVCFSFLYFKMWESKAWVKFYVLLNASHASDNESAEMRYDAMWCDATQQRWWVTIIAVTAAMIARARLT